MSNTTNDHHKYLITYCSTNAIGIIYYNVKTNPSYPLPPKSSIRFSDPPDSLPSSPTLQLVPRVLQHGPWWCEASKNESIARMLIRVVTARVHRASD